jgi:hypothetical protein
MGGVAANDADAKIRTWQGLETQHAGDEGE